jgi:hypothetical protein
MQERPSTASACFTCFSSSRIASRRSIRGPAVCSPRSRRPAAAVTRGSRGRKGRSGWGGIGTGRSIKSIHKQGRFFSRSSPTASSPGSPGSPESSGTAPGKVTRAIGGESILERERSWRGSRCRPEWAFRGSRPKRRSVLSAEEEGAGRSGPFAGTRSPVPRYRGGANDDSFSKDRPNDPTFDPQRRAVGRAGKWARHVSDHSRNFVRCGKAL